MNKISIKAIIIFTITIAHNNYCSEKLSNAKWYGNRIENLLLKGVTPVQREIVRDTLRWDLKNVVDINLKNLRNQNESLFGMLANNSVFISSIAGVLTTGIVLFEGLTSIPPKEIGFVSAATKGFVVFSCTNQLLTMFVGKYKNNKFHQQLLEQFKNDHLQNEYNYYADE